MASGFGPILSVPCEAPPGSCRLDPEVLLVNLKFNLYSVLTLLATCSWKGARLFETRLFAPSITSPKATKCDEAPDVLAGLGRTCQTPMINNNACREALGC